MEQIEVKHTVVRAKSIDVFRSEKTGLRELNKPFYLMKPGGLMEFDFIKEETDVRELKAMIEQGLIYVMKKDDAPK